MTQRSLALVLSALVAALVALAPTAAAASSCDAEVVVRIAMAPGAVCWSYHGTATTFVGEFGAGQVVTAFMRGMAADYDPRSGGTRTYMANRSPEVTGPGHFYAGANNDVPTLSIVTPSAGVYRFSFSPCAMWGAPGDVRICAK